MKLKKVLLGLLSAAAITTSCTSCDSLFLFIDTNE